jgi:hypothetical protein
VSALVCVYALILDSTIYIFVECISDKVQAVVIPWLNARHLPPNVTNPLHCKQSIISWWFLLNNQRVCSYSINIMFVIVNWSIHKEHRSLTVMNFSSSSRISKNFLLDNFLTYLKCLCKFRIDRNKSENTEV